VKKKKLKRYEVIRGQSRCGGAFVIREVGNLKANGWIAASWSRSKADFATVTRLVEQANLAVQAEGEKQ